MSNDQQSSAIRGAIKTTVTSSTEILVAGQEFSIFVTIQNPFEVPLVLHRVSTYLPTEFLDIDQRNRDVQALQYQDYLQELEDAGAQVGLQPTGFLQRKRGFFARLFRDVSAISFRTLGIRVEVRPARSFFPAVVARDVAEQDVDVSLSLKIPLIGSVTQRTRKRVKDTGGQEETKEALRSGINEQIEKVSEALQKLETPPQTSKILQAGNSTTRVFTLRSRRIVWFKPASYRLHIEVEYEIGQVRNVDTIEYAIQVKSSVASMVFGSLLGGLGGWFTNRGASVRFELPELLSLGVSLVFALMAVVLFARKKDVQPLIAVEDFWGGVAIGFLVAYSGPSVFGKLITKLPNSG